MHRRAGSFIPDCTTPMTDFFEDLPNNCFSDDKSASTSIIPQKYYNPSRKTINYTRSSRKNMKELNEYVINPPTIDFDQL